MSLGRRKLEAQGNEDFGYVAGGTNPSGDYSIVDRITYASDTSTASPKGPLSKTRDAFLSTGNSSHGYFAADEYSVTSIDRVDYSNDTATASPKGNLSFAFGYGGGCSSRANALPIIGSTVSEFTNIVTRQYLPSSQRGYFTGGSPSNTSIINRIEFANDTARATLRVLLGRPPFVIRLKNSKSKGIFSSFL